MREILFRIKDKWCEDWYYGMPLRPINADDETCAFQGEDKNGRSYYNILAEIETLGQYVGLRDKNGKKIFDGDIVKGEYWISVVRYGRIGYDSGAGLTGFSLQEVCCDWKSPIKVTLREMETDFDTKEKFYNCDRCLDLSEIEVIGNIHDNKLEDFYE